MFEKPGMDWLLAARARISYRLQDITGDICLLQRHGKVDPDLIGSLGIRAVFISGHGADKQAYAPGDQDGLRAVVRSLSVPMFGFCGGLQFIAETLGASVGRIGKLAAGDVDPHPEYEPGWYTELGYESVTVVADHPLTDGLGDPSVFRQAHSWELKDLPPDFTVLARSNMSAVQLIAHESLPIAGSQFHPEYWTDEHPAGRRLIENFCRWAGLLTP